MWLSAIKLAVSAGSKIYANKQKAKMAMSDAQLMHAEKMARGEEAYQGKLLEGERKEGRREKEGEVVVMGEKDDEPDVFVKEGWKTQ